MVCKLSLDAFHVSLLTRIVKVLIPDPATSWALLSCLTALPSWAKWIRSQATAFLVWLASLSHLTNPECSPTYFYFANHLSSFLNPVIEICFHLRHLSWCLHSDSRSRNSWRKSTSITMHTKKATLYNLETDIDVVLCKGKTGVWEAGRRSWSPDFAVNCCMKLGKISNFTHSCICQRGLVVWIKRLYGKPRPRTHGVVFCRVFYIDLPPLIMISLWVRNGSGYFRTEDIPVKFTKLKFHCVSLYD